MRRSAEVTDKHVTPINCDDEVFGTFTVKTRLLRLARTVFQARYGMMDSHNLIISPIIYHIRHTHVAAKGKLLADVGFPVKPYVSGSLGIGFNQSNLFSVRCVLAFTY